MTLSIIRLIICFLAVTSFYMWSSRVDNELESLQKSVEEIEKRTAQNKAHICNLHREMD